MSGQVLGLGQGLAAALPAIGKAMPADKIEATAKDFESVFLAQMMEPMFGDSIGHEAFGDEESGDVYKGLMMDEYAKQITRAGGLGIADYVKRELLKQQEVQHAA